MARVVHGRRSRVAALVLAVSSTSGLAVMFSQSVATRRGVSAGVFPTAPASGSTVTVGSVGQSGVTPRSTLVPEAPPVQSVAGSDVASTVPQVSSGVTVDDVGASGSQSSGGGSEPAVSDPVPAVSGLVDGVFVGSVESNRWGDVQVEVEVASGSVVDVRTLQYPDDRRKSVAINVRALPVLAAQVLSAQSAAIQGVSGATYTSVSYAWSVQAALDAARRG